MTAYVVLTCDLTWGDERMPCRGAWPSTLDDAQEARLAAWRLGWSRTPDGRDVCPAHARGDG